MAKIVDNVLYSWDETVAAVTSEIGKKSVIQVLLDAIRNELSKKGDRKAVIEAVPNAGHRTQVRMLSEFEPESILLANALLRDGLEKGDVVQISLHNNTDFFFPVLASWMAGGVTSMSDPSLSSAVMAKQLDAVQPKFIFCSKDVVKNVLDACDKVSPGTKRPKIVVLNGESDNPAVVNSEDFTKGMSKTEVPTVHERAVEEDRALIFWSSGTTGNPKGVLNNHRSLLSNMDNQIFNSGNRTDEVFIQTTCMFHGGGFFFCIINALLNGITLVTFCLKDPVTADMIFQACHEFKPTNLMIGSHHGVQMSSANPDPRLDLSSVRSVVPVGAALHERFPEELRLRFPNADSMVNAYGTTETCGIATSKSFAHCGSIVRAVQVKIIDLESGAKLGVGQVGEIYVKTPGIMTGYINVTEEERQAAIDDEGFFKSGDLGWYNAEGVLYYHDRLKALIKYQNFHVYPADLECIIQKHPDIVEVGVFGIPEPSVQELIAVAAVKVEGSQITEEEILQLVNGQVDDYKKIRGGVHFVEKLPRNLQGKLLRRKIRENVFGAEN